MALRIREDGRILCAAIHPPLSGDVYIGDNVHYELSVILRIIVTEDWNRHSIRGEWWVRGFVPEGVELSDFSK